MRTGSSWVEPDISCGILIAGFPPEYLDSFDHRKKDGE